MYWQEEMSSPEASPDREFPPNIGNDTIPISSQPHSIGSAGESMGLYGNNQSYGYGITTR